MCLTSLSICQGALGDLIVKGNALPEEQNNEDNEVLKGQLSRLHLRAQTQQGDLGSNVALLHLPGVLRAGLVRARARLTPVAGDAQPKPDCSFSPRAEQPRATSAHVETAR